MNAYVSVSYHLSYGQAEKVIVNLLQTVGFKVFIKGLTHHATGLTAVCLHLVDLQCTKYH